LEVYRRVNAPAQKVSTIVDRSELGEGWVERSNGVRVPARSLIEAMPPLPRL